MVPPALPEIIPKRRAERRLWTSLGVTKKAKKNPSRTYYASLAFSVFSVIVACLQAVLAAHPFLSSVCSYTYSQAELFQTDSVTQSSLAGSQCHCPEMIYKVPPEQTLHFLPIPHYIPTLVSTSSFVVNTSWKFSLYDTPNIFTFFILPMCNFIFFLISLSHKVAIFTIILMLWYTLIACYI